MEVLYEVFKQHKGRTPPRKVRLQLAADLGLKENQIYKWFWELKQKEGESWMSQVQTAQVTDLSNEQKFEVFVNKSLKQYRD